MDTTIIYYTSNREDETFENKIRDNILKQTNLPIISVSQKPIDFGHNICVGDIGLSYINEWNQILIGLKAAKTEFCIAAESDCLYPPEYFTFTPPEKDKVYQYDNVWIYWTDKPAFYKKHQCEGAQICGREYWIERLEYVLKHYRRRLPRTIASKIFPDNGSWTGNPIITFKTGNGVSNKSCYIHESKTKLMPYWDIKKYL